MDNWLILTKELNYYGIDLIKGKRCRFRDSKGNVNTCGIIKSIKILNKYIKEQKKVLLSSWEDLEKLLDKKDNEDSLCDTKMVNLFIHSLKDLSKYLLCFEGMEQSRFFYIIENVLNRDIQSFNKNQINTLPDYKIIIDWTTRLIQRLLYIRKLLIFVSLGQRGIAKNVAKEARGISGPWANLDLPMEERAYPFEDEELTGRDKDKERQRRYTKGMENYHEPGVGEGHYWREIRNEPFSWWDRADEDPYPHRALLNY